MVEPGRILWAILRKSGQGKNRPAVVLDVIGDRIQVAGCSRDSRNETNPLAYQLPYYPGKHPRTKLTKKTWVICDWIEFIATEDIRDRAGTVRPTDLLAIKTLISQL